jgi:hypothetical protein
MGASCSTKVVHMLARDNALGIAEYPPRRPSYAHLAQDTQNLQKPVEIVRSPDAERMGVTALVQAAPEVSERAPQGTGPDRSGRQEPRRRRPSPDKATPHYGEATMKYGLLWLLGVPIPILIVGYLIFH